MLAAKPSHWGRVAQWLEPTAHNGLVGGSSPSSPTIPKISSLILGIKKVASREGLTTGFRDQRTVI